MLQGGNGNNTVVLTNLNVLDGLMMTLGTGVNLVYVQNVLTDWGLIMNLSASPNDSTYQDGGGNQNIASMGFQDTL